MLAFAEGGKPENSEKNPRNKTRYGIGPFQAGIEPSHIGGRRVLSPPRHRCSPKFSLIKVSRLKSKGYKSDIYFIKKKKTNNNTYLTQIHSLCKWPAIFMKKEIPYNLFTNIHLDQMQTRTTFQLKRNNIV